MVSEPLAEYTDGEDTLADIEQGGGVKIPNWFVRLVTGAIVLATPWTIWVTVTLLQVQFQTNAMSATQAEYLSTAKEVIKIQAELDFVKERLVATKALAEETKREQSVRANNVYAVTQLKEDMADIEARLREIEKQLIELMKSRSN